MSLKNVEKLVEMLRSCELCPRRCRVNRLGGEMGYCGAGKEPMVSGYGPHFGEEPELVGMGGSGTIFLTNCNLLCVYCQNYEISHLGYGEIVPVVDVAKIMLSLEVKGCHNINLVTPTHYAAQLAQAIVDAKALGLGVPIVWNCSGYENIEVVELLEGFIDIYMPDIKYGTVDSAGRYSDAPDYFERSTEAVCEMHRQVGDLRVDSKGVAYSGLLIRHLVLPNDLAGSKNFLTFIAEEISRDSYINIMSQYRPCGKALEY